MSGLTSPTHIALLLVVLLLVFGAKRLPELGRSLGHGMREFKDSIGGMSPVEHSDPPAVSRLAEAPAPVETRIADTPLAANKTPVAQTVASAASPQPPDDQL